MKPTGRKFFIPFLILTVFLGGVGGGLIGFIDDRGGLEPGLHIAGIEVGGLTRTGAEQRLTTALRERQPRSLLLKYGQRTWQVSASKLGLALDVSRSVDEAYRRTRPGHWGARFQAQVQVRRHKPNLPIYVKYDPATTRQTLARLKEQMDRPPRPARLKLVNDQPVVEPDRPGWALNVDATAAELWAQDRLPLPDTVALVVETTYADRRTADLLPMDTLLSQFTTDLAHGYYGIVRRNRTHNVRMAAQKFDGTILQPGEVFSFNRLVGPRKASYGYRTAPVFTLIDGANEVRDEVGGGICQCATTVYNAALLANLEIVERWPHSKIVHYAQAARDATVYFGHADLRFRNTLPHPIAIFARVKGYKLVVTIVGYREDKVEVNLHVTGRSGSYHLTRTVKRNGVQIASELVNRTRYHWRKKPPPSPARTPTSAASPPGQRGAGEPSSDAAPSLPSGESPGEQPPFSTSEGPNALAGEQPLTPPAEQPSEPSSEILPILPPATVSSSAGKIGTVAPPSSSPWENFPSSSSAEVVDLAPSPDVPVEEMTGGG